MADNFIINRGLESKIKLQPINPGALWLTEDGKNLYLDSKNGQKRIQITDVIDLSVETPENLFPNKIYIDGYKLKKYNINTGNLETISNLESEIIESKNEFEYDDNNSTKATLADTSSPMKGTIVVDKNGDVGVVTSSTANSLSVTIIANNKSKNVLSGYDIYFDSNYIGNQVGTFEQPFNTWNELYSKCHNLLTNSAGVTIHVKSNSILEISNNFDNISNVTIKSTDNVSYINFNVAMINNLNNVTFDTIGVYNNSEGVTFNESNHINFVNTEGIRKCNFSNCRNVTMFNVESLDNTWFDNANNVTLQNIVNCNNINCVDSNDLRFNTINANNISIENADYVEIINVNIKDSVDIKSSKVALFNNCEMLNNSNGSHFKVEANTINTGIINFNGIEPELIGTVNKMSGLSSNQVYDTEQNRAYGQPVDVTLKSHLDKISESITTIKNNTLDLQTSGLSKPFSSRDTFSNIDSLTDGTFENIKTGNVFKYVGTNQTTYNNDFALDLEKIVGGIEQVNVNTTNESGEVSTEIKDVPYHYFYLKLTNAEYYCKPYENIQVIYKKLNDDGTINTGSEYELIIDSVSENLIIAKIEIDSNDTNIVEFDSLANDYDGVQKSYYTCTYNQHIKLSSNDRLVYLGNGFDKLSGSSDDANGNYYLVDNYAQLFTIMTNETRPVGVLAYVRNDDMMYQWKYVDDNQTTLSWMEFSSGVGGGSRATVSLYGEPDLYRKDNSNIAFQIQVSNCTSGILRASYQFAGASETKRTVDVKVPYVGIYDITLNNIADRSGLLNVSVLFISEDENVQNSATPVNLTFFIGNLLNIDSDSFYVTQSYNSERKYNIGIDTSKNIDTINLNNVSDMFTLNYDVSTKNSDNFIVYFALYKDNEIITTFESEPTNITGNYRIQLPTQTSDDLIIEYSPGYYKIEAHAEDSKFKSGVVSYEFILENDNPVIVLLNNKELHVDQTDYINLYYIIICNTTIQTTFAVSPQIYDTNDDSKNYAKIAEDSQVSYSDILMAQTISFTQVDCEENKKYLTGLLLTSPIGNDTSSYLSIYFENQNYMSIVQRDDYKLLFNLDSRIKNNNTSNRSIWDSSIVSKDNIGQLYGFSYFDDGWVPKLTDDSNTVTVLTSDGYSTYATLDINPMYKYNDTSIFDCNKGFTFEIKFKYNELYKDGAIIECVNNDNKGFIIKGNKVIWSPYVNIDSANDKTACISRLTTDTWHDISIVLATKSGDNFYKTYMYGEQMSSDSIAMLFIDGVLVSLIDGGSDHFYSVNESQTRMITLFAQYDYTNKVAQNFVKGEIMHIRMYNNALTPDEVLTNYIANIHDSNNQNLLKTFNDYNDEQREFGASSISSLPKLTISNANLSSMDSIIGTQAKNYLFPNVGLKLEYNNKVLIEKYGSVCKCQGTSSTDYAVKNYKITFYDIDEPLNDEDVYNTETAVYYKGDSIHPDSYNTMILDNDGYKRYKYTNNDKINGTKISKAKVSINGWLSESTYTLKADYMDSSHSHNTGTAKFVNDYLPKIPPQAENSPYDDPNESTVISYSLDDIKTGDYSQTVINNGQKVNPKTKIRQAIDGFPCLVVYEYEKNGKLEIVPKGIYQFNIDKNASNIFGYEKYQNCKSYEISNNSTTQDLGAAGFDINILNTSSDTYATDPLYTIKRDFEIRYHPNEELNEDNVDENINYIAETWGLNNDEIYFNEESECIIIDDTVNETIINEIKNYYDNLMVSIDIYNPHYGYLPNIDNNGYLNLLYSKHALNSSDETLRLGLTYIDDYDFKANDSDHHQHDELKHLFMWLHDCKVGNRNFASDITKHFDRQNVERYIIIVNLLGMVDNLAKNMMITSWNCDEEKVVYLYDESGNITGIDYDNSTFCKWYLQFYDLDTCIGLTNKGANEIDTSIEIYGHDRTTELNVEDGEDKESCTDIVERSYNASSSLLWRLVLENFGRLDYSGNNVDGVYSLQGLYRQLRLDVLTPKKIKDTYFNNITDKIGQHYYNTDALTKYFGKSFSDSSIGTTYFYMCQGNAKERMSDWIDKRFIYVDSYYAAENGVISDRPVLDKAIENRNIGALVKAPMYLPMQLLDANTLDSAQLCTSKCFNLINCNCETDATVKIWQANNILALRNLDIFNFTQLNLSQATSLIELNCSGLSNLSDLQIGSSILQKLDLSNTKLTTIDISKLINLVDLDISNSKIETITFSSSTSSAHNIKTLNVANSKLKDLNFETLTSLESFGKIDLNSNTSWNTYDKLLNQIRYYQLAGDTDKGYNDSEYVQKELEYIQKLVNTFKSVIKSDGNLSNFNNDIESNSNFNSSNYYDVLKFMMNTETYRKILAQQYIPNLAILTNIKSSYDNIVFNSDKIRAVVFTTNTSSVFGTKQGSINISSKNIKYLEINNSDIENGTLMINNPNMSHLKITNSNYSGIIDLSDATKLETIDLSSNPKVTDIVYSSDLANNNTLEILNLTNDYQLKSFSTTSTNIDDNYLFDMSGLNNLTTFKISNVIRFKELKGLSLKISSGNRSNIAMGVTCNRDNNVSKLDDVNALGYTASISANITLINNVDLDYLFSGRQNWIFDTSKLVINGLNYCKSLEGTFNFCQQLKFDYVTYIMNNISSICTSLKFTFRECIGIKFPNNTVPSTLFNNCTGVLTTEAMFGDIGRDCLNGNKSLGLYNSLTLSRGVFDNLISCKTIKCMFNDCQSGISGGHNHSGNGQPLADYITGSVDGITTDNVYVYNSYIKSFNIDIFDKMTGLTDIGLAESPFGTIFNNVNCSGTIICTRYGDGNKDRSFNTLFANINQYTQFRFMFTCTSTIRYDSSSGDIVTIDNQIFAKYSIDDNNEKILTSISLGTKSSPSHNVRAMFACMNSNINVNFENLFKYLTGYINCDYMFYKYSLPFEFNPSIIDYTKLQVTSAKFMYAYCNQMSGYLFNTIKNEYVYNNTNYVVVDKIGTDHCFTGQTALESTAGMFYKCTMFGGLQYTVWEDNDGDGMNDTISRQDKANDLPSNLFFDLISLKNSAYMFYQCTSMNIWFDDLYNADTDTKIYLFKNCTNLVDISYMFADCSGLIHELPSYGAPGSKLDDYKYVYYEITDSVNAWLNTLTPNELGYGTSNSKVFYPIEYEFNEETEILGRIYNYKLISTWKLFNDKYKLTYMFTYDITDDSGQVTDTGYRFYQYYKYCDIKDINIRYLGDNGDTHESYINIPGLFCNYTGTSGSSLIYANGVFSGCLGLTGHIPSNIFRRMNKVVTIKNFFKNCKYLGTTPSFKALINPPAGTSGSSIEPPYIYPYSLFDDMIELTTINGCFTNISLLSRPFRALAGNSFTELIEDGYNKTIGPTSLVDEIYALPKYLLYFNTKLIDISNVWSSSESALGDYNALYGLIYPGQFATNVNITTAEYTFAYTHITGSKTVSTSTGVMNYIGSDLFYNLRSLISVKGMFNKTGCLNYLVNPESRDLIFDTSRHGQTMITIGFIDNSGCKNQVFGPTVKGKIVRNNNATTFDGDYQCQDYFINTDKSLALPRYTG